MSNKTIIITLTVFEQAELNLALKYRRQWLEQEAEEKGLPKRWIVESLQQLSSLEHKLKDLI